jgi:hypothetical protein
LPAGLVPGKPVRAYLDAKINDKPLRYEATGLEIEQKTARKIVLQSHPQLLPDLALLFELRSEYGAVLFHGVQRLQH